jgi:hypothetical protein
MATILCVLWPVGVLHAEPPRTLNFGDVGIYACDYDFCDFTNFKFFASEDPKYYPNCARQVHAAKQRGQYVMLGVYTWDRVWHKKPLAQTLADTDSLLDAINLAEVDCLFLNEEEVDWSGGFDYLNALYDHLKQRTRKPVYQWYSMPMGPRCDQKADGWILDAYGMPYEVFRKHVMKFVALGTPTVLCLNATPATDAIEIAQAQVRVAEEFNLPVFYYAVHGPMGSPNMWLQSDDPEAARWRSWFFQTREKCHQTDTSRLPTESAQHSEGVPIEVAADESGKCEWVDDFSTYAFIDRATIHGFLNLRWEGVAKRLVLKPAQRDRRAELVYHWFTPFRLRDPQVALRGMTEGKGSALGVAVSTDGQTWSTEALTSGTGAAEVRIPLPKLDWQGKNLWARVTLKAPAQGQCALTGVRLTSGFVPPSDHTYALAPPGELYALSGTTQVAYFDDFASRRYLHMGQVEGAEWLRWQPGQLTLSGVEGRAVRAEVKQHFRADKPLKLKRLAAEMTAEKSLGAHNEIALSLDGKTPLATATTVGKENENGRFSGELSLDLAAVPQSARVTGFWVHLILANGSGVKTNTSNMLRGWKLEAEAIP